MSLRAYLLGTALLATTLIGPIGLTGCAHKSPPPPETPAAAPAPAPTPPATPAAETPAPATEAPTTPPPECTAATDCEAKGAPSKGMQWACTDSKCAEEKKPAGKKKSKK